jgi:hypothetical protein
MSTTFCIGAFRVCTLDASFNPYKVSIASRTLLLGVNFLHIFVNGSDEYLVEVNDCTITLLENFPKIFNTCPMTK